MYNDDVVTDARWVLMWHILISYWYVILAYVKNYIKWFLVGHLYIVWENLWGGHLGWHMYLVILSANSKKLFSNSFWVENIIATTKPLRCIELNMHDFYWQTAVDLH
jgi:hypothetical protein